MHLRYPTISQKLEFYCWKFARSFFFSHSPDSRSWELIKATNILTFKRNSESGCSMQKPKVNAGQSWKITVQLEPSSLHTPHSIAYALHRFLQPICAHDIHLWSGSALESRLDPAYSFSEPTFLILSLLYGFQWRRKKIAQRFDYWAWGESPGVFPTITIPKYGHFQRLPVCWMHFFPHCVQYKVLFLSTAYERRLIRKLKAKSFTLPCAESWCRE